MTVDKRTLRLQETIQPFGVGAIVDIAGDSLIGMDTSWWPAESPTLRCLRLERQLGVRRFKTPPSVPDRPARDTPSLDYLRFPAWRFCQNCRRMSNSVKRVRGVAKNECKTCNGPMVPMRFVSVCETGSHVSDISWRHWAHRKARTEEQRQCKDYEHLEFVTLSQGGEGLSSIAVVCRACDSLRNLGELSAEGSLGRDGYRCVGRQPWQERSLETDCDSPLNAVQRGTTSLHMAEIISAIDIPETVPRSVAMLDVIRENDMFSRLEGAPEGPIADTLADLIAAEVGATKEQVLALAASPVPTLAVAREGLRGGEWAAFELALDGKIEARGDDFVVDATTFDAEPAGATTLSSTVSAVGLVRRIREVRAMTGFRRYKPEADLVRVDLHQLPVLDWYPAYEQFGEGIFIRFNEHMIRKWETLPTVLHRASLLDGRLGRSAVSNRYGSITPRLILLHTLAHLMIRRLAFSSGYSSASLRERVYAEPDGLDPQAGILIYTASGDSEGTLGGLVRLAEDPQLKRLLLKSIEDADICSNDPVCRESRGQGMNSLNLAACHGCCLVAETSCECANLFLDRRLVVGADGVPGFFDEALVEARTLLGG